MLWQEVPTKSFGFGHPHKIPPNDRQLQVKYLTKMNKRLHQRKSIRTFNGGHPWSGYPEMFQYDLKWNGTMTRGGWSIHNIHLLEKMIALAFIDLREYHRQGYNYFDRNRGNIEAWYKLQAMEMLEKDQTLTGRDITTKCQALYHVSHRTMMEHRARAVT